MPAASVAALAFADAGGGLTSWPLSGREGTDAKRYQEEQVDEAITAVRAAPKP
jgi:hypothetical protein